MYVLSLKELFLHHLSTSLSPRNRATILSILKYFYYLWYVDETIKLIAFARTNTSYYKTNLYQTYQNILQHCMFHKFRVFVLVLRILINNTMSNNHPIRSLSTVWHGWIIRRKKLHTQIEKSFNKIILGF